MSQECQILFLMVLICMAIPVVSSDENCERIEIKKEWSVTCDSQTHQRDYCVPGQRVNDPCSNNVCEYCPAGQFQNVYTNCKTCKNCTTLNDCCPGQVLTRNCTSVKDAKCGCPVCPVCPEEHTPTTCPTVCNTTNQTSTSDDTPVSSLSSDNPNMDTTSWIPSSDTDSTTSSPTSAKDTLSSDCKCVGWKIGFVVAVLFCVILFGVVVRLCLKGNGATSSADYVPIEERTGSGRETRINDGEREPPQEEGIDSDSANRNVPESGETETINESLIVTNLKEENCQLHERIAKLESERIQQSQQLKKETPDSVDAADVSQSDKIASGSTSQQSSLERDPNSATVESDGIPSPAEHQKDHEGDNTASATTTNISGPSSANREGAKVVRKD